MRQKIGKFLRHHRLAIIVALTLVIFWAGRAMALELPAKAAEFMVEPIIERFLESFTAAEEESA